MEVVILAAVAAVVGAVVVLLTARKGGRRAQPQVLVKWAMAKGWVFEHLASRDPALRAFEAFGVGHRGQGLCTVRGALTIAGRVYEVTCGDYEVRVMSASGTRPVV